MSRILLSAVGGPVSVSVIRHLQGLGHQVVGMDLSDHAVGRHFCDAFYRSPRATDAPAYLDFLAAIDGEFDIFFPFVDEELRTIAEAAERPVFAKVVMSSRETLLLCTDKVAFQRFSEERGLPIAPIAVAPPAVAKPAHGRGGRGVRVVDSEAELAGLLGRDDTVVQRHIEGMEYTVDVLVDNDGGWLFGVARQRLVARGVSTLGRIHMDEAVLTAARAFVAAIPFRGPINLQCIREVATGRVFVIEINPRLSGSVIFTVLGGFDVLDSAVELACGGYPQVPAAIRDGLTISRYWSECCEP